MPPARSRALNMMISNPSMKTRKGNLDDDLFDFTPALSNMPYSNNPNNLSNLLSNKLALQASVSHQQPSNFPNNYVLPPQQKSSPNLSGLLPSGMPASSAPSASHGFSGLSNSSMLSSLPMSAGAQQSLSSSRSASIFGSTSPPMGANFNSSTMPSTLFGSGFSQNRLTNATAGGLTANTGNSAMNSIQQHLSLPFSNAALSSQQQQQFLPAMSNYLSSNNRVTSSGNVAVGNTDKAAMGLGMGALLNSSSLHSAGVNASHRPSSTLGSVNSSQSLSMVLGNLSNAGLNQLTAAHVASAASRSNYQHMASGLPSLLPSAESQSLFGSRNLSGVLSLSDMANSGNVSSSLDVDDFPSLSAATGASASGLTLDNLPSSGDQLGSVFSGSSAFDMPNAGSASTASLRNKLLIGNLSNASAVSGSPISLAASSGMAHLQTSAQRSAAAGGGGSGGSYVGAVSAVSAVGPVIGSSAGTNANRKTVEPAEFNMQQEDFPALTAGSAGPGTIGQGLNSQHHHHQPHMTFGPAGGVPLSSAVRSPVAQSQPLHQQHTADSASRADASGLLNGPSIAAAAVNSVGSPFIVGDYQQGVFASGTGPLHSHTSNTSNMSGGSAPLEQLLQQQQQQRGSGSGESLLPSSEPRSATGSASALYQTPGVIGDAVNSMSQPLPSQVLHGSALASGAGQSASQTQAPTQPRFPVVTGGQNGDIRTSVEADGTTTVEQVPSNMLANPYGMVGLLAFIRSGSTLNGQANTGGNEASCMHLLTPGIDLTSLLDISSAGELWPTFQSPWVDTPCRPQDIDYYVPQEYMTLSAIRDKLSSVRLMEKFNEDLLFFIFYMCTGDSYQLLAAQELYRRDWRFHKEQQIWLTRVDSEPRLKTKVYEEGCYYVFDPKAWKKVTREMKLNYNKLEQPGTQQHYSQMLLGGVSGVGGVGGVGVAPGAAGLPNVASTSVSMHPMSHNAAQLGSMGSMPNPATAAAAYVAAEMLRVEREREQRRPLQQLQPSGSASTPGSFDDVFHPAFQQHPSAGVGSLSMAAMSAGLGMAAPNATSSTVGL